MNARFSDVEASIRQLEQRTDARFAQVDGSIRHLEQRMDQRFESIDTRFIWLVGIQVTTLAAVIGALVTR